MLSISVESVLITKQGSFSFQKSISTYSIKLEPVQFLFRFCPVNFLFTMLCNYYYYYYLFFFRGVFDAGITSKLPFQIYVCLNIRKFE